MIYGLSKAALSKRHEVIVFLYSQGVRLLTQEKFKDLEKLEGARILACQTSLRECGFESSDTPEFKVEKSSLSELVEIMEQSDRVIFLG